MLSLINLLNASILTQKPISLLDTIFKLVEERAQVTGGKAKNSQYEEYIPRAKECFQKVLALRKLKEYIPQKEEVSNATRVAEKIRKDLNLINSDSTLGLK